MKNESLANRRILDTYGIDDNRDITSQLNNEKYSILIKRDKAGNADLAHGAYISKRHEDDYGSFRWLNPKGLQKYQTNELAQVTLSAEDLAQLQDTYKNEKTTHFLVNLLRGNSLEPSDDVYNNVYKKNPEIFYYSPPIGEGNGFLIYPNIPYMSQNYTNGKTMDLVKRPEGIQLTAWAVHPSVPNNLIREINGDPSMDKISDNKQQESSQLSSELTSGVKSLTSILDLNQDDIEMLEKLKQDSLQHLKDIYGVNTDKDKVNLFFHFPVAPSTATLHLHIWVNKGDHPLNESRAFSIDDIIQHLKRGESIDKLILSRNRGQFILPTRDMLHKIKGMPESKIPMSADYKQFKLPI